MFSLEISRGELARGRPELIPLRVLDVRPLCCDLCCIVRMFKVAIVGLVKKVCPGTNI